MLKLGSRPDVCPDLGWQAGSCADTILKGDHLRTFQSKFDPNWQGVSEEKIFNDFPVNFLFIAMVAILDGRRGRRIQF